MAYVPPVNAQTIQLDQCLFGYEDGHRLLASSMPLGDEGAALTELSDLAPGTVFSGSQGYWSGVPAPGIGRYALMRTWLAPEMPRPGCVWTHALLIDVGALGRIADLSELATQVSRPIGPSDRSRYREPLTISLCEGGAQGSRPDEGLDTEFIAVLLDALYGRGDAVVPVLFPGRFDAEVFAAWSQQWPRLRRNFRFQTAVTRDFRAASSVRLDLTMRLDTSETRILEEPPVHRWLELAVADAKRGSAGALRPFLWRYGADVRRQRGSFRPLAELKSLDEDADRGSGTKVLELVTAAFPERDDALLLKQDLVDGALVPEAQLDILWYVLANEGGEVFPPPSEAGVARLALLWPTRSDDLLHLADVTAESEDPLGRAVFDAVTGAVPLSDFWPLTAPFPRVRHRMVEARPELLLSPDLATLDSSLAASLMQLVPADSPLVPKIVSRLLMRDDAAIAETATDLFPREVATQVIVAADGGSVRVGRAWIRVLVQRPSIILDPAVMGKITRTSLLFDIAEALGWLTSAVIAGGTEPWIAALVDVNSDLDDDRRDMLRCFLIGLALATGGDGGRRVFEKFFEAVHEQILRSRLPWRARDIISPLLPQLSWTKSWDFGLKLRLAVCKAYIDYGYPLESFAKLSRNKKVRTMLADAARELPGGKALAKSLGRYD